MKRAVVFSGNSNPKLSRQIASMLNLSLGKAEIVRFADSECRVRIKEDVSGKIVFIIQTLSNPVDQNLMEFLLLGDAVKRGEPNKIIGVVPYHGYARQDKVHREGECLSAQVVAKLIETVGYDKLITCELHSEAVLGFFKIPVVHLPGLSIFEEEIKKLKNDIVVVAPDAGGAKRAQKFAEGIGAPLSMIEKKRNLDKLHQIESMRVVGEVSGKVAVIVDDIIVSGGTLVNAAYKLKEKGAKKVIAAATHADFVGGSDKVLSDSPLDQVFVSDSIPILEEMRFDKLKVFSIVSDIASSMKKMIK